MLRKLRKLFLKQYSTCLGVLVCFTLYIAECIHSLKHFKTLKSNYKQINVFTFIIENFKYAKVGRIVL